MVHVHWHIVYWDAGPARASDSVNPILLWTDSPDSDHRLLDRWPNGPVLWPQPSTVQLEQQRGPPNLKSS